MAYYVECQPKRRGSSIVVINVLLFAVLMAVLALGVSNRAASAHDAGAHANSVVNLQLRVASTSIEYTDARDAGIAQWQGAPIPVSVFKSGDPTVVFYQDNNSRGDNAVGMYVWYDGRFDQIFFNKYNILKFNFGFYDKRWIGVHELGHSLRLAHSNSTQTCWTSVMCAVRTARAGEPWTPQPHDVNDVNAYW